MSWQEPSLSQYLVDVLHMEAPLQVRIPNAILKVILKSQQDICPRLENAAFGSLIAPPGQQPPPGKCHNLERRVPPGAFLVHG